MANLFLGSIFGLLVIASCVSAQNDTTCLGENQEYSECSSFCPPYCNQEDIRFCFFCKPGCRCKDGYIKEAVDSDRCIPMTDCNKMPKCGANREYRVCGSACPKYCGQPADVKCARICKQGCQCKEGYVKSSEKSETCIPEDQCPK